MMERLAQAAELSPMAYAVADATDALAKEKLELEAPVENLDKACTRYKMETSTEKTKLMTNSVNGIQREIKKKGHKLGTVTSFKYLGAIVSDEGSKPEVHSSHCISDKA